VEAALDTIRIREMPVFVVVRSSDSSAPETPPFRAGRRRGLSLVFDILLDN
jgi:hypothetical protein